MRSNPIVLLQTLLVSACADLGPLLSPSAVEDTAGASANGIQAIGAVTEMTGGRVAVELVVMGFAAGVPVAVAGVAAPEIFVDDVQIDLLTTATTGTFYADSTLDEALVYEPGTVYEFGFDLVSENGREEFAAIVTAPERRHDLVLFAGPMFGALHTAGQGVEVGLRQMTDGGIVRVVHDVDGVEALTWTSFAYTGPGTAEEALQSLRDNLGPSEVVPGDAFPEGGDYVIEVVDLAIVEAPLDGVTTPNFAAGSWFAAGSARRVAVDVIGR